MPMPPKPPSFDALLALVTAAPAAADLAAPLATIQTYFSGSQREQLEAAVAKRQAELLPDAAVRAG